MDDRTALPTAPSAAPPSGVPPTSTLPTPVPSSAPPPLVEIGPVGVAEVGPRGFLSPLNRRRWQNFAANRRGYWSLWIFLVLFVVSLFAEFIANDKPYFISF